MLTRLGIALRHTAGLCRRATSLKAEQQTFEVCESAADLLNLRQPYPVAISAEIQSPAAVRVLRPQVLLPVSCVHGQEKALRYILLHEFTHCKYRDPLFNLLMQLFLCLNWMNPAVWYVVRQMEADREACCDHLVLEALCGRERIEYGHVLLSWAGRGEAFAAVGMGSGRTMLHRRILRIASYKPDSSLRQKGSALLLLAAMLLTFVLAPSVHGLSGSRFQPSEDLNISYENLESYFDGQEAALFCIARIRTITPSTTNLPVQPECRPTPPTKFTALWRLWRQESLKAQIPHASGMERNTLFPSGTAGKHSDLPCKIRLTGISRDWISKWDKTRFRTFIIKSAMGMKI